jgi:thioredoxin-related protein
MHKIVLGILLLSSTLFSLEWVKDLDTAFTLAKKEHKDVMVMVEGENCRWCKKFKHRTLTDESVEKRLEKFIVVKVMREDEAVIATLPPIQGVPTVFFMTENREVIKDVLGYRNIRKFTTCIDSVEQRTEYECN